MATFFIYRRAMLEYNMLVRRLWWSAVDSESPTLDFVVHRTGYPYPVQKRHSLSSKGQNWKECLSTSFSFAIFRRVNGREIKASCCRVPMHNIIAPQRCKACAG